MLLWMLCLGILALLWTVTWRTEILTVSQLFMLFKLSILIELRKRDEFDFYLKNEKRYFWGPGTRLFLFFFFFFLFGLCLAIEILKALLTVFFLKHFLMTIIFKEKSKKMSCYIAEEYLAWIPFRVRCKNKICKCTQGLPSRPGLETLILLPQSCCFIKQKSQALYWTMKAMWC